MLKVVSIIKKPLIIRSVSLKKGKLDTRIKLINVDTKFMIESPSLGTNSVYINIINTSNYTECYRINS